MEEKDIETLKYLYFRRLYNMDMLVEYFEGKYRYSTIKQTIMNIIRNK